MVPKKYSFGQEKHLKSRKQIEQLFAGGKSFFVHPIKVFWQIAEAVESGELVEDSNNTVEGEQMTDDRRNINDSGQITGDGNNIVGRMLMADNEVESKASHLSSANRQVPTVNGQPTSYISIGVSASKRNFKKAADRNRVKRLLREAYRLNQHSLVPEMEGKGRTLNVFFIFVDKTLPTFALVEEKMLICLKRLQKITGEAKNEKLL